MIIIFDLDYTLIDTEELKKGWAKAFGVSYEVFSESFLKLYKKDKFIYKVNDHLKYLIKKQEIEKEDIPEIKKRIEELLKNIDKYLLQCAFSLVKNLKKNGHTLILITFGNKKWQKQKVDNLSIKKYFDKIIYTDQDKRKHLGFLKNSQEKILIVNDNSKESFQLKSFLNNAEVFLVKGPYSDNYPHKTEAQPLYNLALTK